MPSSLRRRERRLVLGANKKIRIYPAEGNVTVGVMARNQYSGRAFPLKADKGAERSSSRRKRGRRGLRKGKTRARGRHPRDRSIRQPPPNIDTSGPKARVLRSHLRMCDWHRKISDGLVESVRDLDEKGRFRPPRSKDRLSGSWAQPVNWGKTRARWQCLHNHLVRTSSKFLADVALSHQFTSFIEDQCHISLRSYQHVVETNASSFASLLSGLKRDVITSPETEPGIEYTGVECTGKFCRTCGRLSSRGSPCPGSPRPLPSRQKRGSLGRTRGVNADKVRRDRR